ncbi:YceI family protein [Arhodomonas aquaeolei]|uniref:YceI family protein n=1 Tax=Arhodomonas aquaeolei TaxID=2369 RepID=UPI000365AA4F|nr:YceI family protein [Arhodomonas aquaeolei]
MYDPRFRPLVATLLAAALTAGCAGTPARPGPTASAAFPADAYRALAADGTVYRLDPAASSLQIIVYRGGPLAEKGHNHIIEARDFRGLVFLPDKGLDEARLDLAVPARGMVADPPAARSAAGGAFAHPLNDEARTGTRANMLGPQVLDAGRFPQIAVHADDIRGALPWLVVRTTVTLHGRTRRLTVPVEVQAGTEGLTATGRLVLRQSDFGITPITAMGGLLRVQDTVTVAFRLVGRREGKEG